MSSRSESEIMDLTSEELLELQDHELMLDDEVEVTRPTAVHAISRRPPPPPPKAAPAAQPRDERLRTASGVFPIPEAAAAQNAAAARALTTAQAENQRLRAQMRARDAYLGELERALDDHNRQLSAAGLGGTHDVARLLGRVRGQAFRIAELESELRRMSARLNERASYLASDGAGPNDLRRVRGIGPRFAEQLAELGVSSVAQIAEWTEDDVVRTATRLHIAPARIAREAWIEQARALLEPDQASLGFDDVQLIDD